MRGPRLHEFAGTALEWNAMIAGLPGAHLLQTWEWAELKSKFGWQMMPLYWDLRDPKAGDGGAMEARSRVDAAAMVLKRSIIGRGFARRLSVIYVPRGPLLDWANPAVRGQVLDDLEGFGRDRRALLLKIDPDAIVGTGFPQQGTARKDGVGVRVGDELKRRGWRYSDDQVQFRNTVVVDLSPGESEMLGRMKPKARYNVRLAERKGITLRTGSPADLPALYRMYAETSIRDGFVIRSEDYYMAAWASFLRPYEMHEQPSAEVLIAEFQGQSVAAVFVYYFARRAYYLYGMSIAAHREKMPNHMLQWEAMRRARGHGCETYDLWGAPDEYSEADPLWGVYRFKEGLGGEVVRTLGAWDYPASAAWYHVYTRLVPRILSLMRSRGRRQVRSMLAGE